VSRCLINVISWPILYCFSKRYFVLIRTFHLTYFWFCKNLLKKEDYNKRNSKQFNDSYFRVKVLSAYFLFCKKSIFPNDVSRLICFLHNIWLIIKLRQSLWNILSSHISFFGFKCDKCILRNNWVHINFLNKLFYLLFNLFCFLLFAISYKSPSSKKKFYQFLVSKHKL